MDRINLGYSKKNILIPSRNDYLLQLTAKTEHFIKRMRWKVMEFEGQLNGEQKKTYGFKTRNTPPPQEGLKKFENDMADMIKNIEFKRYTNNFLETVKQDVHGIKHSGKVIVSADKSANMYTMEKDVYKKHLMNCITKDYKKAASTSVHSINAKSKEIAQSLHLADRMECMKQPEAYVTVKDHKPDFYARPSFRLINPSKTDVGKISKDMLDEINSKLLASIRVNQWKNTKAVINWFDQIDNKSNSTFIQFDIVNFYPSITPELFNKAFEFASHYVEIPDYYKAVITHARETLLFSDETPWTKQNNSSNFDVPMGSWDGAEVCELVGAFIQFELCTVISKEDFGLYRDDGLGVMGNIGRPEIERRKKKSSKFSKSINFQ